MQGHMLGSMRKNSNKLSASMIPCSISAGCDTRYATNALLWFCRRVSNVGLMAWSQSLRVYFVRMAVRISSEIVSSEVKLTAGLAQVNNLSMSTLIALAVAMASLSLVIFTSFLKSAGF